MPFYGWIVSVMIRRGVRRINAGDIRPMLSSFANDATLVFPGDHSWGGEYKGKAEIEKFLRRFVEVGIQLPAARDSRAGLAVEDDGDAAFHE